MTLAPEAPAAPPTAVQPLAVRAAAAAELLGVSLRFFRSLDTSGRLPRGVSLGRTKLWRMDELRAWLAAGAPCRDAWEAASYPHQEGK
jgi:predicted DNA-binding transcriptional regulator AlpA